MLGLEPTGDHLLVDPAIPSMLGQLELLDIPGRWGCIDAFGRGESGYIDGGRQPTMKLVVSPIRFWHVSSSPILVSLERGRADCAPHASIASIDNADGFPHLQGK